MSEILNRCEFCSEKMADGYFEDRVIGDDSEYYLVHTYVCNECAEPHIQRGEKFEKFHEPVDK